MMASYDSQGVPVLSFHNPAAAILYPRGLYSYSFGNTRGQDVTENLGIHENQHLDVLLLASGDVRNVLFTVSGLSLRKPVEHPKSISFHLNDYDPSVVARNAIILEIVNTINPEVDDDVDFLWNVWYNLALSKDHFDRLRATLAAVIDRDFDECESFLKFRESNVLQECQDIWKDWKELDLDVDSVKEERMQLIREKTEKTTLIQNVIGQIMMTPNFPEDVVKESGPYYQEIKHWFEEGSTNNERHSVNPTLIRPFVHKWRVHYGSCALEGYLPISRNDLMRYRSLTGACKETLRLMVKRFQQFKTATTLTVFSWTGDGLLLCSSGLPQDMRFDIIDTSNVIDHIGLLNVLVCCSPRLKRPNESQLFTSSMLWANKCKNIMEYYNKCLGVHTCLLPTILGLKLAVDFDLGSRRLPDKICSTQGIFCWVKTEKTRTVLTLEEGSDIIRAFFILVERCFDLDGLLKEDQVCGPNLSSPLTLLRILHQLDPLVEGGAPRILDLLQSKLPSDFQEKFGLSWNLIAGSLGSIEPVVEVNVQIDIYPASWCTPIPMILIRDNAFKKPIGAFESAISPSFFKRQIIYNSLRYDDSKRLVTFHILEKDWDAIKDTSCLDIVSNTMDLTLSSEPVCLKDEGVVCSVRRVDPVKTFGLDCVQTFDVRPKKEEEHIALEVNKVEESEFSYKAEIAILDPNKSKGKMNVHFYPERCPTNVSVKFEDGKECTMYFSCSVDENSSKFQISRKQGKVFCQISKREDGTVGERVLQNPAPIPFHALEIWDSGYDDTMKTCGHMFRTELDMKLKSERQSGDAFFDLRETISAFLKGHLEKPRIPKVFGIEDHPLVSVPYNTLENIKQKKGFLIKVGQVYRWNALPLIKVIFYDCKRLGDVIKKNPTGSESNLIKRSMLPVLEAEFIPLWASQKELDLLRKMLYTNATRVPQEADFPLWKASFITLLFPRERNNIFFEGTALQENLLKSLAAQTQQEAALPGCQCCGKKSGDLKRCMGCKKVSYCSRDCQKEDWKQNHKAVCRKS